MAIYIRAYGFKKGASKEWRRDFGGVRFGSLRCLFVLALRFLRWVSVGNMAMGQKPYGTQVNSQ